MYISLNNKNYEYNINQLHSFYSIRQDIDKEILKKNKIEANIDQISITYNGAVVDDNKSPQFYNIKDSDTIYLKIKNDGGAPTATNVILLIVFIFVVVFFLIPAIIFGVLPFLSFLVSKVFIKGITIVVDFLRSLTDTNNWLNSFLATFKSIVIPVISFIFYYAGLVIIIYFAVFFSVYYIYSYIYKGNCLAYKASKILSFVTVLAIGGIYFLASLPNIIKNITALFLPSFVSSIIAKGCNSVNTIKEKLATGTPFIGGLVYMFITLVVSAFELLNKTKFYGPKFLYEWDKMYQWTLTPEMNRDIRLKGLRRTVNGIDAADKYKIGKTVGEVPYSRLDFSVFVILRFGFQTLVSFFIQFIDLFDLCGQKPETIVVIEEKIRKTDRLINDITSQLDSNETSNTNKKDLRDALRDLSKTAAKLLKDKEKEELMKQIDVDCMKDMFVNGALSGVPTLLIFIILFVLLCIPSIGKQILR